MSRPHRLKPYESQRGVSQGVFQSDPLGLADQAYSRLLDDLLAWAESGLSKHRFQHVRGVQATVLELAAHYGWGLHAIRQAEIAAIVHDIARESRFEKLLQEVKRLNLPVSDWDLKIPLVLHARVAPAWLSERFGLHDPVIADAIWDHTTGHPEMSHVGKLLYVADKLEAATRDPLWRQPGWQIATDHQPHALERALIWCLEESLSGLRAAGKLIHPDSLLTQPALARLLGVSLSEMQPVSTLTTKTTLFVSPHPPSMEDLAT